MFKGIFKGIFTNWRTSLFGGVPGAGMIADGITTKNWMETLGGIGLLLTALFAEDHKTKTLDGGK